MKYIKTQNKIIVEDLSQFNINQILDCGQIFRYVIEGNTAIVFSKDKKCDIVFNEKEIEILTNDEEYFYDFFIKKSRPIKYMQSQIDRLSE